MDDVERLVEAFEALGSLDQSARKLDLLMDLGGLLDPRAASLLAAVAIDSAQPADVRIDALRRLRERTRTTGERTRIVDAGVAGAVRGARSCGREPASPGGARAGGCHRPAWRARCPWSGRATGGRADRASLQRVHLQPHDNRSRSGDAFRISSRSRSTLDAEHSAFERKLLPPGARVASNHVGLRELNVIIEIDTDRERAHEGRMASATDFRAGFIDPRFESAGSVDEIPGNGAEGGNRADRFQAGRRGFPPATEMS